jgi:mannose-1-phosphate guanylyltransferase
MDISGVYAVIMAGGKGERFWPQSRNSHPKQLLRLIGNLTLIEQTVDRLRPVVPPANIMVVTNTEYVEPMRSLLSALPPANIIGEPVGKDTAPCAAAAAAIIRERHGSDSAVIMLLPADHIIRKKEELHQNLKDAVDFAGKNPSVVTVGVSPSFPSTGYGYIHCGARIESGFKTMFFKSLGFKEKPDSALAGKFFTDKTYKWNSGMFIFSCATFIKALEKHSPALLSVCANIQKSIREGRLAQVMADEYKKCERISIDYAVMEKADNIVVAECLFDWDDVGSWTALRNQIRADKNNNVSRGLFESIDTQNCIVVGDAKHLVATVDIDNIIVVHTDDATLVCSTRSAQKIKDLLKVIGERPELSRFL